MSESIENYYDPMASDYHLLFANWRETVAQESETLDVLIRAHTGLPGRRVLDCSCGIGTQSIALALRDYDVTGLDLSEASLDRAAHEAESFDVGVRFAVGDLRALDTVEAQYDVVLALDNALPHLQTDEELLMACCALFEKTAKDGLFMATMRDYDLALTTRPRFLNEEVFDDPAGRRIIFQVWDWDPHAPRYKVHQFIVLQRQQEWRTSEYEGEYRALRRNELGSMLGQAGFSEIAWLMPEQSGYYQPMVTARRRGK